MTDMAARHDPQRLYTGGTIDYAAAACWLIFTGTSNRLVQKPGTLDIPHAAWSMGADSRYDLGKPMYGHRTLAAGRLRFDEPELMQRMRQMLDPDDYPVMDASDKPPHVL